MDQRQTQKSIQHAVKRVMELSSLKRTTRNLAEVIEQAMAELHAHRRRRMTRKNSRPPSVRDRENKREAEERYAAEEMLGMHAGACHLRDSPPEDREWAETVRELKKDRVRNERAIEKSWLMMEEEKRLDALSPRLRICSLSVMAWAQYVRLNKLARRKAVVQANARALNAVRKLRARNTKMCALQNLVASAVAKKDKKRQVARHLKKAAAAHFVEINRWFGTRRTRRGAPQAVFSANHADDRFQTAACPSRPTTSSCPSSTSSATAATCGRASAEPAQALRSFHGKISYRGKWGGPSPKPKPPEAAAPPDFDDASFVSFRGTVDRPLGLGGRVPPWLACGDDDDESLPSCVSPLARPAIVPPSLPVAPPSSSDILGAKGGAGCFARARRLVPASSRALLFSPLAAAIAVEDRSFAPQRPASRGVAHCESVF
ncbi:hypothetical protein JL722_5157 [Aureococcus anophagefferens]|nr:hypothetical protein JL722_5157 [Aureococcus anophagefferens]